MTPDLTQRANEMQAEVEQAFARADMERDILMEAARIHGVTTLSLQSSEEGLRWRRLVHHASAALAGVCVEAARAEALRGALLHIRARLEPNAEATAEDGEGLRPNLEMQLCALIDEALKRAGEPLSRAGEKP